MDALVDVTEQTTRHLPGFISAIVHRDLDGERVINYVQRQSRNSVRSPGEYLRRPQR